MKDEEKTKSQLISELAGLREQIALLQRDSRLRIEIRDWGIGFDPEKVQENRFGLEGIRERARLLGGKCRIRSKLGSGTSVVVDLPIVPRQREDE